MNQNNEFSVERRLVYSVMYETCFAITTTPTYPLEYFPYMMIAATISGVAYDNLDLDAEGEIRMRFSLTCTLRTRRA
jgi:hypothetical protein